MTTLLFLLSVSTADAHSGHHNHANNNPAIHHRTRPGNARIHRNHHHHRVWIFGKWVIREGKRVWIPGHWKIRCHNHRH